MSGIHFFSEEIQFRFTHRVKIRSWIRHVLRLEGFKPGSINFIFVSDDYLLEMNMKHLNHNTLTDILTFPDDAEGPRISGDIFISVDRVRENAEIFDVTPEREMQRVLIHGVLHLMGYSDITKKEKAFMRAKEDECLHLYDTLG